MSKRIWASGDQLNASDLNGNFVNGGTGADGALSISSGTTTVSIASAAVFVKNYSRISLTGTGKLAFSNPNTNGTIIVLNCSGNCTLTSSSAPMVDASGMGAAGGASVSGDNVAGTTGTPGKAYGWQTSA